MRALADDHFERMENLLHEVEAESDAWEAFAGFVWRAAEMMAADRGLAEVLAERPEAMASAKHEA